MKVATVLYCPPPTAYASAGAILENLKRFPPKHELILFSDFDHKWPGQVQIKVSPEIVKNVNKFAINNLVWLTGLRLAKDRGVTHLLNLEADCRVGVEGWDDRIFDEYFNLGRPCIAAGTLAVYNPCAAGLSAARRWEQLVARNMRKNVPVATYGWMKGDQKGASCLFPNGALSVMDMAWVTKFFDLGETVQLAQKIPPWDMALGLKTWELFGEESYEVMGYLESVFSGYGDALTTEDERMEMLRSGKVVATHQVKGVQQP